MSLLRPHPPPPPPSFVVALLPALAMLDEKAVSAEERAAARAAGHWALAGLPTAPPEGNGEDAACAAGLLRCAAARFARRERGATARSA